MKLLKLSANTAQVKKTQIREH